MLSQVTAVRFDRPVSSGRTKPCFIGCIGNDGSEDDLVVKFAAGCETRHRALMTEAVCAMLAADLDLPVPEPFLVLVEADFAATIPDSEVKSRVEASLGWNFGSRKLPPGFGTYPRGKPLPQALLATAAEIIAFDAFIANPDRTAANPNLLFDGGRLAIYDHELAFLQDGILGWRNPWEVGGIRFPQESGRQHVFQQQLKGRPIDLGRFSGAFEAISPSRLNEYWGALPSEWVGDAVALNRIVKYLGELRDHINEAVNEVRRALQ